MDPTFNYLITQGNDRTVKVWNRLKSKVLGFHIEKVRFFSIIFLFRI